MTTGKLAINGGPPVRETFLQYARPSITEDEINEVADTLRSGWLTTGPKTALFEKEFRGFIGGEHVVAVNSGTAALHLALASLDIGLDDEVIVPSYTFAATAEVVTYSGATPILCDVDPATGNMRPHDFESAISERTRAVIPVHFGGLACDIASIRTIAAKHGIAVVEDAAHALPSRSAGELVGSRSEYACFSFYATKNLTTGEGGAFVTSDENIADRVRRLSLHGLSRDAWKRYESAGSWYYEIEEPGFKYNMTDIAAAMGLAQLRRLPALHAEREHLAGLYDEAFSLTDWLNPQPQTPAGEHGHHLYVLRLNPARLLIGRDKFIEALNAENIGTSVHFIPLHMHPYYRDRFEFPSEAFPGSLALYEQAISLPMYPGLSSLAQNDVINAVMKIGSAYAR